MNCLDNFFPPQVFVHFSDSSRDFKLEEDQVELSFRQKEYLAQAVKPEAGIFYGRQVHGKRVVAVSKKDLPVRSPLVEADGFVTNMPGLALLVRTADCLPVFLFDPRRKAVGMIHAGWRGTQQKIAAEALAVMQKEFGGAAVDIRAALGPRIGPCCYTVGEDFKKFFPDETIEREGKIFFDLALANTRQLIAAGVKPENIKDTRQCTACDEEYFSYRRQGDKAGRHVSVIMLK